MNLSFEGVPAIVSKQARQIAKNYDLFPDYVIQEIIRVAILESSFIAKKKLQDFELMLRLVSLDVCPEDAQAAAQTKDFEDLYLELGLTVKDVEFPFMHFFACRLLEVYAHTFSSCHKDVQQAIKKYAKKLVAA